MRRHTSRAETLLTPLVTRHYAASKSRVDVRDPWNLVCIGVLLTRTPYRSEDCWSREALMFVCYILLRAVPQPLLTEPSNPVLPHQINARDKANQTPLYVIVSPRPSDRARTDDLSAGTGLPQRARPASSTCFSIRRKARPRLASTRPTGWVRTSRTRLRDEKILTNACAAGNTPLHLAMESAHAEAACLLIEAGADRTRVGH